MAFVLTTQTNPGSAEWSNTSILGSSWVQFTDPGDGGTLNTGIQSGSCVALVLGGVEQCTVAPPQQLGQMLTVSAQHTPPLGPAPMASPRRNWNFTNPIDTSGNIGVQTGTGAVGGVFSQFEAVWVTLSGTPTLTWRLVVNDGCNLLT